MNPDDARHFTNRGYTLGCREHCCTNAHRIYMNLYRMGRQPSLVDPRPTVRRVQALLAIGHTGRDIGNACGKGEEWARMVIRSQRVTTATRDAINIAYERMSMTVPKRRDSGRLRRAAVAKGYMPPLSWDNIDDLDERPKGASWQEPTRGEVLDDLVESGATLADALRTLDVGQIALERWCDRNGYRPVYNTLNRRQRGAVAA